MEHTLAGVIAGIFVITLFALIGFFVPDAHHRFKIGPRILDAMHRAGCHYRDPVYVNVRPLHPLPAPDHLLITGQQIQ
jgi:hypothetical protein